MAGALRRDQPPAVIGERADDRTAHALDLGLWDGLRPSPLFALRFPDHVQLVKNPLTIGAVALAVPLEVEADQTA